MKKNALGNILLLLIITFMLSNKTYALPKYPEKPITNIYVQDYAGMLSGNTVMQILEEARYVDIKTTAQICIVTINSLEGSGIEEYANTLFRKWGIGNRAKNNGILLLLSRGDREIRIEVGYGLEGRINDAKAGRIIRVLGDYLKQGKTDEGVYYAFSAIAKEIYDEYGIQSEAAKYQQYVNRVDRQNNSNVNVNLDYRWGIVALVIFVLLMSNRPGRHFLWIMLQIIVSFGGRGRGGGGGFGGGSGGGFGGGSSGGGGASGKW